MHIRIYRESDADPRARLGYEVVITQEDESERKLMPGYTERSREGHGWASRELTACGDTLGRIAVVGIDFDLHHTLDIYSKQDGKCSASPGSDHAKLLFLRSLFCTIFSMNAALGSLHCCKFLFLRLYF